MLDLINPTYVLVFSLVAVATMASVYGYGIAMYAYSYPQEYMRIVLNALLYVAIMYKTYCATDIKARKFDYLMVTQIPLKFLAKSRIDLATCFLMYIVTLANYYNASEGVLSVPSEWGIQLMQLIDADNVKNRLLLMTFSLVIIGWLVILFQICWIIREFIHGFSDGVRKATTTTIVQPIDMLTKSKFRLTPEQFELQKDKYPFKCIDIPLTNVDELIEFASQFISKFSNTGSTNLTQTLADSGDVSKPNEGMAMIGIDITSIDKTNFTIVLTVDKDITRVTIDDFIFDNHMYAINLRLLCNIIGVLKKLQLMVGLVQFKQEVLQLIMSALHYRHNHGKEPMMHVALMGSPGVGKTELAKIVAELYIQLDLVSGNQIIIAHASNLIGMYIGSTENKTQKLIDKANHNVLIIDEADSIADSDTKESFGKTGINVLNANLDKRERDFKCIITGYSDRLKNNFFGVNEGLNRRFRFQFEIKGYDAHELMLIFLLKLGDSEFVLDTLASDYITEFFDINGYKFVNFAGDVDNFMQKLFEVQMFRVFGQDLNKQNTIMKQDLKDAIRVFNVNKQQIKSDAHTSMYS
jgi:stage V sporulation protein K